MISPGREPWEQGGQTLNKSPKGPTDTRPKRYGSCRPPVCRPSGAQFLLGLPTPGLTPRANHLSPLRGSHPVRSFQPISSNPG
jgi:hypothetical protein